MQTKNILALCLCLLVYFNARAQEKYRAIHWDVEDGLPIGLIDCMLKDAHGFLWISTGYGVSRFDGNTFKNYFGDKNSNKTIIDNNTKKLIEDSLDNIWVGTVKGASRYDIKADTFSHFFPDADIGNAAILPFRATRDNVYCIESGSLITAYNIHSLAKKTLIKLTPADLVGEGMAILYSIFDTSSNSVWMLDGAGGTPGGGLYQINLSTDERKYYAWPCYKNIPNHSHWSEAMCYDRKRNSIWINSPDGLIEFTLDDKQFHHINALNEFDNLKNYNRWVGIDLDPQGRIWLATQPNGIIIYDPARQSVTVPFPEDTVLQNKVADANLSIYCDRDGIVWSGFWYQKGLYQLIPFSQTVKQYATGSQLNGLSNNIILNCVNGEKGRIWMGTLNGLNIFDPQTDLFKIFHEKDLPGLKGSQIIPVGIDTLNQKAWLHTERGFFEMDIRTKNCRQVIFKNAAHHIIRNLNPVTPLYYGGYCQYKNGCIIPAFYDGQLGFFLITSDSLIAHQILALPGKINLYRTSTGNDEFLFLQNLEGMNLTYSNQNGKWIQTLNPLDSIKRKRIIYSNRDASYWVMCESELCHYNKNFQLIRKYTRQDGLPSIEIYSVIEDNNGNIWFSTHRSISELNVKTGRITTMTEKDGFQKQNFSTGACVLKDAVGDLYFASGVSGDHGFIKVSPSKLIEKYPPSTVYIRSLEVNQSSTPFSTGISNLNNVLLKYFENNISVETGIIDYYSKGKSQIRYKLEGINNNWQYAPANYTIRYAGLPPGKYNLVMQASNAVNEFNGPVRNIAIHISPPFWKTWWFISLIAIIIAVGIYALFQFRLKQKMRIFYVRQKLHRDLHDDVGATLSSIKVYSDILQNNADATFVTELIKTNAADMIDKLEMIAWATDPQHDSFKSFKEAISQHASAICYTKNIDLNIQYDGINENMMMPGDIRQNLFLIFKEAVNNIIKYSGASKCTIQLFTNGRKFYFTISDNGKGFSQTIKNSGNGLKNMKKRAKELNGLITIKSDTGKGAAIVVILPYPFKIPSLWEEDKPV